MLDNMALVAHLDSMDPLTQYQLAVDDLLTTLSEKTLEVHITKTKELCCEGKTRAATTLQFTSP